MKIFGHPSTSVFRYAPSKPQELDDIEIVADPATLRRLAAFFQEVANDMESKGQQFDHVHLLDAWNAHGDSFPDIILSQE